MFVYKDFMRHYVFVFLLVYNECQRARKSKFVCSKNINSSIVLSFLLVDRDNNSHNRHLFFHIDCYANKKKAKEFHIILTRRSQKILFSDRSDDVSVCVTC